MRWISHLIWRFRARKLRQELATALKERDAYLPLYDIIIEPFFLPSENGGERIDPEYLRFPSTAAYKRRCSLEARVTNAEFRLQEHLRNR
jgi:hypothetical protein